LGATNRLDALVRNGAGTTVLNSDTVAADAIAFAGTTRLTQVLTTLDTSVGNGTITLNTVEGTSAGTQSLDLRSGSNIVTLGTVGATTRLDALTHNVGTGTTRLNGDVIANSIDLSSGTTTLAFAGTTTLDTSAAGGAITFAALTGTSTGSQALTANTGTGALNLRGTVGATRLGALTHLGSGATNIGLAGTQTNVTANSIDFSNGPTNLAFIGTTTLSTSAVGGQISLGAVDGTTADQQSLTLTSGAGNMTLGALGGTTRLGAFTATTTGAGIATFNGDIDASAITLAGRATFPGAATLNTSATGGTITLGGTITAGGNFAVDAGVGATTLSTDLTIDTSAANGAITLNDVNGTSAGNDNLTLTAGAGAVNLGALGGTTRLGVLTRNGAGTTTLNSGTLVARSINLSAGGTVLTQPLTTLDTSANNGTITLGTVDGIAAGAQSLDFLSGAGAVSLTGTVGGTMRLGALTHVTGTGGTIIAANAITADSIAFTTGTTLLYFAGLTTLDTSAANGTITLGTLEGSADGAQALTLDTGAGALSLGLTGSGAGNRLGALTHLGPGTTTLNANISADAVDFSSGPTLLAQTVTITTTGPAPDGSIRLGAVDATTAGVEGLTLAAGTATVDIASVGATTRLASFTRTGSGTTNFGSGDINANAVNLSGTATAATLDIDGALTAGGALTLDTSAANGAITLDTVDGAAAGAQDLTLAAGAGTVTLGTTGATRRLNILSRTGAGTTVLNGATVAADQIDFSGTTQLTQPLTTLDTSVGNGPITLGAVEGTVAGAQSLNLASGNDVVTLGTVGATTRLNALTHNTGTGATVLNGNVTANAIDLSSGGTTLTFAGTTVLDTSAAGGAITLAALNGTTAGQQAFTANTGAGALTLGATGGTRRLGAMLHQGNGATTLNGSVTADSIDFSNGDTILNAAAVTLTTNAVDGNIALANVDGVVAGANALTLSAGNGTVALQGALGGTTRLGALTRNTTGGAGATILQGGTIAANSVNFAGPVTLDAPTMSIDTSANNGALTLAAVNGTTAGANALNLNAGSGTITVGGAIGGTTRLGAFSANTAGGGSTIFNANVSSTGLSVIGAADVNGGGRTLDGGTGTVALGAVDHNSSFVVIGDDVTLSGAWTASGGTQTRTLQPFTAGQSIGLGGAAGGFNLDAAELNILANGTVATGSVTIGVAGGTGAIAVNGFTFDRPMTIRGGSLTTAGALTKNAGNLTLNTTGSQTGEINLAAGAFFSFSASDITYTNTTINGDGGTDAAQHATNLGGGAGPFLINGVAAGQAFVPPPALPGIDSGTVSNIVNNAINAVTNNSLYSGSTGQANDSIGNLAFAPLPASGGYVTDLPEVGSSNGDGEDDEERRARTRR
jgi:hypothetical protein